MKVPRFIAHAFEISTLGIEVRRYMHANRGLGVVVGGAFKFYVGYTYQHTLERQVSVHLDKSGRDNP